MIFSTSSVFLIFSFLVPYLDNVASQDMNIIDPEERLIKYLLLNNTYEKSVRPGAIKNGVKLPLKIKSLIFPERVISVDDKLEIISLMVVINEAWLDQRLKWNPKDFGNMKKVRAKADTLWTPRTYFPNLQTLNRDDKMDQFYARIFPNSVVTLTTYALLSERCDLNMTYFPFDRQLCQICPHNTQYFEDSDLNYEIVITRNSSFVFMQGGQWELLHIHNSTYGDLQCFDIELQRKSTYYIINLIVPTLVICILNTIGLFASIDTDQSELDFATMGQTTLLALSVMLLTIVSETPKGSVEISLMGAYFLIMIFQTLIAAVTAVYLKKRYRSVMDTARVKNIINGDTTSTASAAVKSRKRKIDNFIRKHCAKMWLIIHLILIIVATVVILGIGFGNQRDVTIETADDEFNA